MNAHPDRPPWVWEHLPVQERRERWEGLVGWVRWLEQAYAPWVVLPACWPAHEGLRAELTLFWYWHAALVAQAVDPPAGATWNATLRQAAAAWRQLATCDHREPGPEHQRIAAARRARRDELIARMDG